MGDRPGLVGAGFYNLIGEPTMLDRRRIALAPLVMVFGAVGACSERSENQQSDAATSSPPSIRQVSLDGQSNFRDIGGYETADGRTVRWGRVYRSGRLSNLSDDDVSRLEELEINSVVNFLTSAEIEADGADRLPPSVRELRLPMEAGNMNELTAVVGEARRTGDFSGLSPEINPGFHRQLIVEGKENYAEFLRQLANQENLPLVYHCSHGVHRTGTATAILLSALGVPWETVREDYLLSNDYRREEVGPRIEQLKQLYAADRGIDVADVDATNIEAFYVLQGHYIDGSLEQAIADFGSMDSYIREGLGLSDEEIEKLRQNLLAEAP